MGLEAPAESAGGAKTLGPGTKVGV